jgi:predicted membrane-bound dolichyl-phosphate-mannose-protein mannosyltransferase
VEKLRIPEWSLKPRKGRVFLAVIVFLLLLSFFKAYTVYNEASSPYYNDYVSDEVWYVPSARNMLYNIFHVTPEYVYDNRGKVYTLVFPDKESLGECTEKILKNTEIEIVRGGYEKINVISVVGEEPDQIRETCPKIIKIMPGYPPPDKSGIYSYYNLEHPPLGKYLILLSMYAFGDYPTSWRIPGVIEAFLITLLVGLIGWRLLGVLGSVLAGIGMALDPLTTHMASVAMLDMHLAFFTALTAFFFVYDRKTLTVLSAILSGMVKYSGFFILPFVYVYIRKKGYKPSHAIAYLTLVGAAIIIIINAPIILHFGIHSYITEVIGALKWHTSSRPPGPATSNPIEWVLGWNPFMLHVNPDIAARGSPILYAPGFVVSLIVFILFLRKRNSLFTETVSGLSFMLISIFLGYAATMAAGNRTLYSFYMTQASPILCALLPSSLLVLAGYKGVIDKSVLEYKLFLKRILRGKIGAYTLPSELSFTTRFIRVGRWGELIAVGFTGIAIASLLIHLQTPSHPGIYSDAQWISSGGILRDAPGRLMGLQGLITYLLIKTGATANHFLILDAFFLAILANEYLIYTRKRLKQKCFLIALFSLSLLLFGAYDGTIITLFFFLVGYDLYIEKNRIAPFILALGTGNPVILATTLVFLSRKMRSLIFYVITFLSTIIPLAYLTGTKEWVQSFINLYIKPGSVSILLPLGDYASVSLPLLALALFIAYGFYHKRSGDETASALLSYLLISFLLIPTTPPQWLIPFLVIGAPYACRSRLCIARRA